MWHKQFRKCYKFVTFLEPCPMWKSPEYVYLWVGQLGIIQYLLESWYKTTIHLDQYHIETHVTFPPLLHFSGSIFLEIFPDFFFAATAPVWAMKRLLLRAVSIMVLSTGYITLHFRSRFLQTFPLFEGLWDWYKTFTRY